MIFVTGSTGFLGRHLIAYLSKWQKEVRVLISPNQSVTSLAQGVGVEIAVSSLDDESNLRAALKNVDTIFHFASDEHAGNTANLLKVDIRGTETLVKVAKELNITRIIFISHLGAEPSSAYPLLKAKGQAEQAIISSDVPYTIFKTAPIYGEADHFINRLASHLKSMPIISLVPEKGKTLLQPIWVDDIITAAVWASENPEFQNRIYEIGGPEYFSYTQIIHLILNKIKRRRILVHTPQLFCVFLAFWLQINRNLPISSFDLDYLAIDRTAPLDTLIKTFGIQPKRLENYLIEHQFTSPGGTP